MGRAALPVSDLRLLAGPSHVRDRSSWPRIRGCRTSVSASAPRSCGLPIAAARKVDKALAALGRAYDEYSALPTGGTTENAQRVSRRAKWSLAVAIFRAAPILASEEDSEPCIPMGTPVNLELTVPPGRIPQIEIQRAA